MHLKILAVDLDGTLAMHDKIAPATWQALLDARDKGMVIILVTGRRMSALHKIAPFGDLCEAIVAENGSAIHFTANRTVVLPFGQIAHDVLQQIRQAGIPHGRGMSIVSTWIPHDKEVLEILGHTGYAATIEYNKGAVMILPPGATKGTGLLIALQELGYSPRNVVAVGDAENDRSLFEQAELAAAVENATREIKEIADIQLPQSNGAGVASMLQALSSGNVPAHKCRPERQINLGHLDDGNPMLLSSFDLVDGKMGIFGSSGSGKSWIGGLLAERLLQQHYQLCIIDPEGDYRGLKSFPHTLLLGGSMNNLPESSSIATLMEYSGMSLVLDLSQYSFDRKREFVEKLMAILLGMREQRGKPHWFLIDEAHYFTAREDTPLSKMLLEQSGIGGYSLVSYRPAEIAPALLKQLDQWIITHMYEEDQVEVLRHYLPEIDQRGEAASLSSLTSSQVFVSIHQRAPQCGKVSFGGSKRQVPHIRHLHKYLRAPLPDDKQFFFRTEEDGKTQTAGSLWELSKALPEVSPEIVAYHLKGGHLEAWIDEVLHDQELARRVHKISNRNRDDQSLKDMLSKAVEARFRELEMLL